MKRFAAFLAVCTLLIPPTLALSADRGPSTSEEPDRLVRIAKALEQDPAAPGLRDEREWAIKFLIAVPDIHVTVCAKSID